MRIKTRSWAIFSEEAYFDMRNNVLLYFVKYPEPGKVKTRLAKTIGFDAACETYRRLAEHIFHTLTDCGTEDFKTVVLFDPPAKEREIRAWLPSAANYWPQEGEGLGERLLHAFKRAFDGERAAVVVLGSDTVGLKADILRKAFDALSRREVVLGPTQDGGYYLLGLSSPQPILFEGIPWSSGDVLGTTLALIRKQGLTHSLLPVLEDLDEIKVSNQNEIVLNPPVKDIPLPMVKPFDCHESSERNASCRII